MKDTKFTDVCRSRRHEYAFTQMETIFSAEKIYPRDTHALPLKDTLGKFVLHLSQDDVYCLFTGVNAHSKQYLVACKYLWVMHTPPLKENVYRCMQTSKSCRRIYTDDGIFAKKVHPRDTNTLPLKSMGKFLKMSAHWWRWAIMPSHWCESKVKGSIQWHMHLFEDEI